MTNTFSPGESSTEFGRNCSFRLLLVAYAGWTKNPVNIENDRIITIISLCAFPWTWEKIRKAQYFTNWTYSKRSLPYTVPNMEMKITNVVVFILKASSTQMNRFKWWSYRNLMIRYLQTVVHWLLKWQEPLKLLAWILDLNQTVALPEYQLPIDQFHEIRITCTVG